MGGGERNSIRTLLESGARRIYKGVGIGQGCVRSGTGKRIGGMGKGLYRIHAKN